MRKNISGFVFGKLTAIKQVGYHEYPNSKHHELWEARCECGVVKTYIKHALLSFHTTSCGCVRKDPTRHGMYSHGQAAGVKTSTWVCWAGLKHRKAGLDPAWATFEKFFADMGERPEGLELDRIKNELPYGPGNCRWVTRLKNMRNRTNTVFITFEGETLPLAELAERYGLKYGTVFYRYRKGVTGAGLVKPSQHKSKV
jgi:hypothetical protein